MSWARVDLVTRCPNPNFSYKSTGKLKCSNNITKQNMTVRVYVCDIPYLCIKLYTCPVYCRMNWISFASHNYVKWRRFDVIMTSLLRNVSAESTFCLHNLYIIDIILWVMITWWYIYWNSCVKVWTMLHRHLLYSLMNNVLTGVHIIIRIVLQGR